MLHALAAIRSGDQSAMRKTYAQLLPAEDEVAGAGSGMLALGPVAGYLGRLARAQGENDRAERHFAKERAVLAQLRQQTEGPATHEG